MRFIRNFTQAFFFAFIFWTGVSFAEESITSGEAKEPVVLLASEEPRPLKLAIQLGLDFRFEEPVNTSDQKDTNQAYELGFLLQKKNWALVEELIYSQDESSGGVLSISYQALEWNHWVQYHFVPEKRFHPYLGLALGLSANEVTTKLSGVSRSDQSRIYFNYAGAAGISYRGFSQVEFLCELRVWKFEQKKDPISSGLLSVRYFFENY
ncbi:MAG: hypothetical protein GW917_00300 [Bdellovibrionales bacterium]|nr:hypothetical protein [Bdellovibrionales bacterium]